jgi:hypothetical protein
VRAAIPHDAKIDVFWEIYIIEKNKSLYIRDRFHATRLIEDKRQRFH